MKVISIILLTFTALLTSCATRQSLDIVTLKKGTKLIKHVESDRMTVPRTYSLVIRECKQPTPAVLELKDEQIRIELLNPSELDSIDKIKLPPSGDPSLEVSGKYRPATVFSYFASLKKVGLKLKDLDSKGRITEDSTELNGRFFYDNKLLYRKGKPVFQALSIPFKIRPSKDLFPSTVSTGFNAGVALGYNWEFYRVRPILATPKNKMVGYETRKFSVIASPFIGLTTVGLTPENTQQSIQVDQSVLGVSTGATVAIKINNFNIGPAIGFDWGLKNSDKWVYQGSRWIGIIIGIDTFK